MKFTAVTVMRPSKDSIASIGKTFFGVLLLLVFFIVPVNAKDVSQAAGNLLLTPNHGQGEAWGKAKCSSCHFMKRLHDTVPKLKSIIDTKGFATCTGCHGSNGTQAARQCLVCHNVKDLPGNPIRTGKHRHDFNLKKDLPTTSAQCVVCHAASDMDGAFEVKQDLTMFNDKDDPKVEGIVEGVGTQPYADVNDFCIRCHNKGHQQKKHPIKNPGKRDQSINAEGDFLVRDKHGKQNGSGTGLYAGLRKPDATDAKVETYKKCNKTNDKKVYQYNTGDASSIVDCVDCHAMHGTINPGLIIDNSLKGAFCLDPSLRNKAYKIEILDGVNTNNVLIDNSDYSQLCVLCHNMQTSDQEKTIYGGDLDTGNGLSGVHFNSGSDCVTCHFHGASSPISGL